MARRKHYEKYLWGIYQGKKYALLAINESPNQAVFRIIGSPSHLTLHKLEIIKETREYYEVNYQSEPIKLSKNVYVPVSYNWNSPILKGAWSDDTVEIAKKMGFCHPEKHACSTQGIVMKDFKTEMWDIGSIRIKINDSSAKQTYLNIKKRLGSIRISSNNFMIRFIFSTCQKSQLQIVNYDFVVNTSFGNVFIKIDETKYISFKI